MTAHFLAFDLGAESGRAMVGSLDGGIEYLTRTQNSDGSWTEHETTGTGFPRVFYLKYDMYRNSWPLLALGTYKQLLEQKQASEQANGHVNGTVIDRAVTA